MSGFGHSKTFLKSQLTLNLMDDKVNCSKFRQRRWWSLRWRADLAPSKNIYTLVFYLAFFRTIENSILTLHASAPSGDNKWFEAVVAFLFHPRHLHAHCWQIHFQTCSHDDLMRAAQRYWHLLAGLHLSSDTPRTNTEFEDQFYT